VVAGPAQIADSNCGRPLTRCRCRQEINAFFMSTFLLVLSSLCIRRPLSCSRTCLLRLPMRLSTKVLCCVLIANRSGFDGKFSRNIAIGFTCAHTSFSLCRVAAVGAVRESRLHARNAALWSVVCSRFCLPCCGAVACASRSAVMLGVLPPCPHCHSSRNIVCS
jgi:hypothetical protein